MRLIKWTCAAVFVLLLAANIAPAREGSRPLQINNRLRFEYDDNIYQLQEKTDSFKIIDELEFLVDLDLQNTFLSARYRPSIVWWDNREGDSTDFQNEFDLVLNQTFTPRLSLNVLDTFRRGEQEQLINPQLPNETAPRDFWYNTLNGTLSYLLRPATRLDAAGRWIALRYDDSDVSDTEDFDDYVAGLTLRQQVNPKTAVLGEVRGETIGYSGPDRDSESVYLGGGLEQVFNPSLIGNVIGGYQQKTFSDDQIGDQTSPYVDASLTYLPSPATRLTGGAGYSMFETEIFPYANQRRTTAYLSFAHDLTAKISAYLTGSYTLGNYNADEAVDQSENMVNSGDDKIFQVSARATYQLNRNNWLEGGWQYTDYTTELKNTMTGASLRDDYDRNRFDVGWKTQF